MSAQPQPVKLGRRILRAIAAMGVAALLAVGAWQGYRAVLAQPLKRVVFVGDVERLPRAELEAVAQAVQSSGPEGAKLADVRAAAKRIPWVRDAQVRRRHPDTVEISFELHQALARWGDAALVSPRGEVFVAKEAAPLPRFTGPEGSAPRMVEQYPLIAQALAPLASPLVQLRLSPRGAWEATLASGLTLELGRGDVQARAERFVAAWPQVAALHPDLKYADLRYPNGFAVRRTTLSPALSQGRGRSK